MTTPQIVTRHVHRMLGIHLFCSSVVILSLLANIHANAGENTEKPVFVHLGNLEGMLPDSPPFSRDNEKIVTRSGAFKAWSVRVWKVDTLRPLTDPLPHRAVRFATFTPDSKRLLTADRDTLHFWDIESSKSISAAKVSETEIFHLVTNDAATHFTIEGIKGQASLWEVLPCRQIMTFPDRMTEFVFSRDGAKLVARRHTKTPGMDSQFVVYDTRTGKELIPAIASDLGEYGTIQSAVFSPDGKRLALLRDKGFVIVDAQTGKTLVEGKLPLQDHHMTVQVGERIQESTFKEESDLTMSSIEWGASGDWIYTSASPWPESAGPLQIWSATTGNLIRTLDIQASSATQSPDGKWLLCEIEKGLPELWDVASGQNLQTLDEKIKFRDSAISPDGRTIAFSGQLEGRGKTSLWRLRANGKD